MQQLLVIAAASLAMHTALNLNEVKTALFSTMNVTRALLGSSIPSSIARNVRRAVLAIFPLCTRRLQWTIV
jgi:hypothetical protein